MLPILYSLQHCPYAMRARFGLVMAQQQVMLRAVVTKNKPEEMLAASPKGTIPVLILPDSRVIDESLDIMIWALQQNDPEDLLHKDNTSDLPAMIELIERNDQEFKPQLEIYKKAKRFHQKNEIEERQKCEVFIAELEQRLTIKGLSTDGGYFMGQKPGLIDYALLPFVRQFSRVNRSWFVQAPYPNLRTWLDGHLQSRDYAKAMAKYPLWLDEHEECLFGGI
ncbi:MAG: glutathione S-transferase [Alteromonadaceae bacterium]|nr:MAG: glutathione S-transferase [Alteromonadaceae bacterium]